MKSNSLSCTVEVNDDIEDELLNEEFQEYPKIIVMNKTIKKGVKEILEDESINIFFFLDALFCVFNLLSTFDIDYFIKYFEEVNILFFILFHFVKN